MVTREYGEDKEGCSVSGVSERMRRVLRNKIRQNETSLGYRRSVRMLCGFFRDTPSLGSRFSHSWSLSTGVPSTNQSRDKMPVAYTTMVLDLMEMLFNLAARLSRANASKIL